MTVAQLKEQAGKQGVAVSGTKGTLIARLLEHIEGGIGVQAEERKQGSEGKTDLSDSDGGGDDPGNEMGSESGSNGSDESMDMELDFVEGDEEDSDDSSQREFSAKAQHSLRRLRRCSRESESSDDEVEEAEGDEGEVGDSSEDDDEQEPESIEKPRVTPFLSQLKEGEEATDEPVYAAMKQIFGYDDFRDGQLWAIKRCKCWPQWTTCTVILAYYQNPISRRFCQYVQL